MPPRIPNPITSAHKLPLRRISTCSLVQRGLSTSTCPRLISHRLIGRPHNSLNAPRHLTTTSTPFPSNPRDELRTALSHLQKVAANHVNISRLQLALRGLDQPPGQETIRIAIHGLGTQHDSRHQTKELIRLLIADPLVEEEEWERSLLEQDMDDRPILLKIGPNEDDLRVSSNRLVREIYISSPVLNPYNLEILVHQSEETSLGSNGQDIVDSVLIPTVDIPTSNTGRYTPVTTPVHRAAVLANGIQGAASLTIVSDLAGQQHDIATFLNLPAYLQARKESLPFSLVDIPQAKSALASFRKSVDNAMEYEREWFDSGLPLLSDFVKGVPSPTTTPAMLKPPVISLISTIISEAHAKLELANTQYQLTNTPSKVPLNTLDALRRNLQEWSRRSHTELRDTLETAFHGRRWRKLNWWKLFWHVDDVSMIATDILAQRFLPEAEKEMVFLAGKIDQAGVSQNLATPFQVANWAYKEPEVKAPVIALGTVAPDAQYSDLLPKADSDSPTLKIQPWPLDVPITRGFLAQTSVPALQALAQKLLFQTLGTSGFATAFAALIYVSDSTTSIYEVGAVAALGIVWSMRRLQTRWERARAFWEDEVREEGRRAIRAAEASVENVLKVPESAGVVESKEYVEGMDAIIRVEKALAQIQDRQSSGV